MVELGSGVGLVGISVAMLGVAESVTLTDLKYSLPLCEANIGRNRPAIDEAYMHARAEGNTTAAEAEAEAKAEAEAEVTAEELDWFEPPTEPAWDVVLAADTVWLEELVAPFVKTLAALCPVGQGRVVFMAYQRRGKTADEALWRGLEREGFTVARQSDDGLGIDRTSTDEAAGVTLTGGSPEEGEEGDTGGGRPVLSCTDTINIAVYRLER